MDYVSIQFSSLFVSHCHYDQCCCCINSVNFCTMQLSFRLDKPGESYLALDGKKILLRWNDLIRDPNGPDCAEGRQPSKPTWVSVQDVVLNSLRPSTQPSQPLPELSHFYTSTKHEDVCSCRYGSCWCVTS